MTYPLAFEQLKGFLSPGSLEQTAGFLAGKGFYGPLVSVLVIVINTLFPITPFILIAGANALVFGLLPGFIISLVGTILGSILGYWGARFIGRDFFLPRLAKYKFIQKLHHEKNAFRLILSLRLIPVFPASVVNYGAGVSPVGFGTFLVGTLIGKIPVVAWETIVGHDALNITKNLTRLAIVLAITAILFVITWKRYRKFLGF